MAFIYTQKISKKEINYSTFLNSTVKAPKYAITAEDSKTSPVILVELKPEAKIFA